MITFWNYYDNRSFYQISWITIIVIFFQENIEKSLCTYTGKINFLQLLPLCFFLIYACLSSICNAIFCLINFNLFKNITFFKRLYWRYQLLRAALHHKRICVRWVLDDVLFNTNCIILFSLVSFLLAIVCYLHLLQEKKNKTNTHLPSGWCLHSNFVYGDVPDPLKIYAGKDCVEMFIDVLRCLVLIIERGKRSLSLHRFISSSSSQQLQTEILDTRPHPSCVLQLK